MLDSTPKVKHVIRSRRVEIELILACCGSPLQLSADDSIGQILDSGVDWELLLELMDFHRVALIVGRRLSLVGTSGVPEGILERVRHSQYEATLRALRQTAELLSVLKILQQNDIQVIPFKGPVLATYLYGDLSLRESYDIDLIVHQEDVLPIKRILASVGYLPWAPLAPAQEAAFIRSECVYELRNPDKSLHLELHWKNSKHPSLRFPANFVWDRQRETELGGMRIKTLPPEALLLLLCAHGTKHSWQRLRYVCDIADTVRVAGNMDWKSTLNSAAKLGASCMLLAGLSLAHDLLKAPLSNEILREIQRKPQVQRIAAERFKEIFESPQEQLGYWSILRFNLRSFDNWHGRVRYLIHMLLRPGVQDFQAARLPRFLFPLYPCIRLLRLLRQFTLRTNPAPAGH